MSLEEEKEEEEEEEVPVVMIEVEEERGFLTWGISHPQLLPEPTL